ncbi:hypothetical protein GGR55DRAFT_411375 [Xylaria sp. FL0064]|nr:hypothetical protein GGR55DRAFT_411375 [Xylaria sp. FL0064]
MADSESPRTAHIGPGGFLPRETALPSPTPSSASSRVAALLPHPRSKPLVPGSRKEDYARDYVARRLLHISRRYIKKFGIPDPADEITGYENMEQVCRDLEEVVDVLWFSGTPSLQVPYLLNVALAFNTYLPSFPPAPRPTFALLRKLDHCFASLLVGFDVKTKDPLPGFSSTVDDSTKMRFSRTDMVRCKSLADETRMLVAMVMSGEVDVFDYDEGDEVIASRPARTRTEARSDSAGAPDPASNGFQGVEIVKPEEIEDDDDDLSFNSGDEESTVPAKRKAGEMSEGVAMSNLALNSLKVKIEDKGDPGVNLSGIIPTSSPVPPIARGSENDGKGQFHWALEDEDDSDGENQSHRPVSAAEARDVSTVVSAIPSALHPPESKTVEGVGRETDDNDADEEEEELGEYDEDDEEEDEELEMNVGRVYEKTLVQLGQSLGQSIIDD